MSRKVDVIEQLRIEATESEEEFEKQYRLKHYYDSGKTLEQLKKEGWIIIAGIPTCVKLESAVQRKFWSNKNKIIEMQIESDLHD